MAEFHPMPADWVPPDHSVEEQLAHAKQHIALLEEADSAKFASIQALRQEIAVLRAALEDIVNPLAALSREAEAQGRKLSGMANQIANDPAHLQRIARAALNPPNPVRRIITYE